MQRRCLHCTTESAGSHKFFFSGLLDSCDRTHSALMFVALISAAHFSISLLINLWRYSGDLRSGATKINSFSAFGGSAAQCWHARVEECRAARLVVISRTRA